MTLYLYFILFYTTDEEWEGEADMCGINDRSVQWLAKIKQISSLSPRLIT